MSASQESQESIDLRKAMTAALGDRWMFEPPARLIWWAYQHGLEVESRRVKSLNEAIPKAMECRASSGEGNVAASSGDAATVPSTNPLISAALLALAELVTLRDIQDHGNSVGNGPTAEHMNDRAACEEEYLRRAPAAWAAARTALYSFYPVKGAWNKR